MLKKAAFLGRLIGGFKARRFVRGESGAALIEMTLVLPLMLLICAGVFEFSNLFYKKLLVEAGLRDAARYMARCPSDVTLGFTCSQDIAKNIAAYGSSAVGTPRVPGWDPADVTFINSYTTPNPLVGGVVTYRGPDPIATIRVETTFTYTGTSLLNFIGLGGSIALSGAHEERHIGW